MRNALTIFAILAIVGSRPALAGLDVSAYSKLVEVEHPVLDADGFPKDAEHEIRLSPVDFPERFEGLKADAVYRFGESFDFRAGSYTGYNWWRNELAKLAGYPAPDKRYDASAWNAKSGAFWELINFSDAEGVLGPVVCKKLYADFVSFHKAAMRHPNRDFVESYEAWERAFKLAAEHGAIVFH
jgi:hypothetical protein